MGSMNPGRRGIEMHIFLILRYACMFIIGKLWSSRRNPICSAIFVFKLESTWEGWRQCFSGSCSSSLPNFYIFMTQAFKHQTILSLSWLEELVNRKLKLASIILADWYLVEEFETRNMITIKITSLQYIDNNYDEISKQV